MTMKIREARTLMTCSDCPEEETSAPHVPRLPKRTVGCDLTPAAGLSRNRLMSAREKGGEQGNGNEKIFST